MMPMTPEEITAMPFRDFLAALGLSQTQCSRRFQIPLRTVQNWTRCVSACPPYIRLMMAEIIGKENEK